MSSPKLDSGKFLCFLIDRFTERVLARLDELEGKGPSSPSKEQEEAVASSKLALWERL